MAMAASCAIPCTFVIAAVRVAAIVCSAAVNFAWRTGLHGLAAGFCLGADLVAGRAAIACARARASGQTPFRSSPMAASAASFMRAASSRSSRNALAAIRNDRPDAWQR